MADERTLTMSIDGDPAFDGCRIKISGRSTMSCVPDVWQVDIYNAPSTDIHAARKADRITVYGSNKSVIGYGKPTSVYVHSNGGRQITSITLEDGSDFWRSHVSVTMDSGCTHRQAADIILLHSTVSATIAQFPNDGTIMQRGQTYNGRTVQFLSNIAKSLGCRLWHIRDTLRFSRINDQTEIRELDDADITNDIARIDTNCYVIDTDVVGIQVGTVVDVNTDDLRGSFLVVARSVDADSYQGEWASSIVVIDRNAFTCTWEGCY